MLAVTMVMAAMVGAVAGGVGYTLFGLSMASALAIYLGFPLLTVTVAVLNAVAREEVA